jgi:Zn-dependent peptidase ImmA (M78 family)
MLKTAGKKISWDHKCDLARQAMQAAVELRLDHGAGLEEPVSAYSICDKLSVMVRFVDINMEGVYIPKEKPRIHVSIYRPLGRRHFTCAHELGHHIFGHGASLDDVREDADAYDGAHPDEFLADAFAGHLLMPVLGIRQAFSRRGIRIDKAVPKDILSVSTEFGVGYEALLTQLAFAFNNITPSHRSELLRSRPAFRRKLSGGSEATEIFLIDDGFMASMLDIEVNCLIVAPEGTTATDDILRPVGRNIFGIVFRATRRGTVNLVGPTFSRRLDVRVAPERFIGLAQYRYLEDGE